MAIIATEGKKYTPAPADTHVAVCCDVVDLGVLEITYKGETKKQHKIDLVWQIDEINPDFTPPERFRVRRRYTLSLSDKAALRADLESWRGRPFTPAELGGFDVEQLIGKPCMINVVHETKDGKGPYANVKSIMRLPKGTRPIDVKDYVRVKDRPKEGDAGGPPDMPPHPIDEDDPIPF